MEDWVKKPKDPAREKAIAQLLGTVDALHFEHLKQLSKLLRMGDYGHHDPKTQRLFGAVDNLGFHLYPDEPTRQNKMRPWLVAAGKIHELHKENEDE